MALLVIAFVAGAVLTAAGMSPGIEIARAYDGGRALYEKYTAYQNVLDSDLWFPERTAAQGVTTYDASRAQDGVMLYASGDGPAAYLMSLDGEVLHEWRRPFSTVWHEGAAVRRPQSDEFVYFRDAVVYPNGDLLVLYEGVGDTPYGYGVAKLDRSSNLIWSYLGNAHHDLDVGPDGRIYVLTHEFVTQKRDGYGNVSSPRLDDFLVVLSPDGEELAKISLIDVVADSKYRHLMHTVSSYAVGEPLHANDVDVITPQTDENFLFGRQGQVLISFRELGAIGVVDVEERELVWATRGPWIGQHDPDILPDGRILLFDNYGNYSEIGGPSRVLEFDPRTMATAWKYAGTGRHPLDSQIRAEQQRLENGNTLIVESNGGRVFEVTRDGDIVWEFVNPVRNERQRRGRELIPIIAGAERIDAATLDPTLLEEQVVNWQPAEEPSL